MIRAVPEAYHLAAFLMRTLPEEHRAEARALVPEVAVMEWVAARRRTPRKDVAQAMASQWKISRATAYRCLACIDACELPKQGGDVA